jgi:hypothetical protein
MNGQARAFGVAALVGIYATFALDCFSTFTSSPQTTELNAGARTPTLMKWVGIGGAVAVGGGLGATLITGSLIPLAATLTVAVLMWLLYRHASASGLGKNQATESYG